MAIVATICGPNSYDAFNVDCSLWVAVILSRSNGFQWGLNLLQIVKDSWGVAPHSDGKNSTSPRRPKFFFFSLQHQGDGYCILRAREFWYIGGALHWND